MYLKIKGIYYGKQLNVQAMKKDEDTIKQVRNEALLIVSENEDLFEDFVIYKSDKEFLKSVKKDDILSKDKKLKKCYMNLKKIRKRTINLYKDIKKT